MFPIQIAYRFRKARTRYAAYKTSEGYALHFHKLAFYVYLTNERLFPRVINRFA